MHHSVELPLRMSRQIAVLKHVPKRAILGGNDGSDGDIKKCGDCPISYSFDMSIGQKIKLKFKHLQPGRIWMMQVSKQRGNIQFN